MMKTQNFRISNYKFSNRINENLKYYYLQWIDFVVNLTRTIFYRQQSKIKKSATISKTVARSVSGRPAVKPGRAEDAEHIK